MGCGRRGAGAAKKSNLSNLKIIQPKYKYLAAVFWRRYPHRPSQPPGHSLYAPKRKTRRKANHFAAGSPKNY